MSLKLEQLRREYLQGGLTEDNLKNSPFEQFNLWLSQAIEAQLSDPTAMTLATVSASGKPSQRIVLLKHADEKGFVFYTNYASQKAQDIAANPNVNIHFPWHMLERQIEIAGTAEKISAAESMKYFLSRPRESQLAAWASKQSHRIDSRKALMMQFEAMRNKFREGEIPLPDFWGGYRVVPTRFEFWQGGGNRLHDRFEYVWQNSEWLTQRLAP